MGIFSEARNLSFYHTYKHLFTVNKTRFAKVRSFNRLRKGLKNEPISKKKRPMSTCARRFVFLSHQFSMNENASIVIVIIARIFFDSFV